jgi:hypothetical protein
MDFLELKNSILAEVEFKKFIKPIALSISAIKSSL